MPEEYTGVKFEAERVDGFSPSVLEKEKIARLLSLKDIYKKNQFLDKNGGNFSFRAGKGFIIKRTGVWIENITANDFVRVLKVESGKVFYEGEKLPSSECRTHALVYRLNPDVGFILHAHAMEVSGRDDLPAEVCVLPEQPYGTPQLAKAVAEESLHHRFIVAKNHGVFAFDKTFEGALKILLDSYAKYR